MVRHAVLALGEDAVTGDQYNAVTQLLGRPQELRRATNEGGHRACIGACAVAGCSVLALGIGVS